MLIKMNKVFIPNIPYILPVSRMVRDNMFIRDVLIYDENKRKQPRMSWYDPSDKSWIPDNWFHDGLVADMKYYFSKK